MDGLTHPRDLEAWHRWQDRSQPVGRRAQRMLGVLRDIARPDGHAGNAVLTRGGPQPRVLVCLESRSPTSVRALLEPVRHLDPADVAVIAPTGVTDLLPEGSWTESPGFAPDLVAESRRGRCGRALDRPLPAARGAGAPVRRARSLPHRAARPAHPARAPARCRHDPAGLERARRRVLAVRS